MNTNISERFALGLQWIDRFNLPESTTLQVNRSVRHTEILPEQIEANLYLSSTAPDEDDELNQISLADVVDEIRPLAEWTRVGDRVITTTVQDNDSFTDSPTSVVLLIMMDKPGHPDIVQP